MGRLFGIETEQIVPESGRPQHAELVHEATVATTTQVELGAGYRLTADTVKFFMCVVVTAIRYVVIAINRYRAGCGSGDTGVIDDAFVVRGGYAAVRQPAAATGPGRISVRPLKVLILPSLSRDPTGVGIRYGRCRTVFEKGAGGSGVSVSIDAFAANDQAHARDRTSCLIAAGW